MVATSGARLLQENAIRTMCDELLPLTSLLTPNIPEAILILKECGKEPAPIKNIDDLRNLAKAVSKLGPKHVLIKGGHCPLRKNHTVATTDDEKRLIVNIFYSEGKYSVFEAPYQQSRNTHGTGCSLACEWQSALCATPTS